ncbi:hypothetical protein LLH00_13775 [bacterium]|nr:hypothetical protein [bacterium]
MDRHGLGRLLSLILLASLCAGLFRPLAAQGPAGRRPLPFLDQAAQDSSFLAFRKSLVAAVRAKDASVIYACLSPEVFYSFEPFKGTAGLTEKLQLQRKDSPFWGVLDTLLAQGGGFIRPGLFAAPYVPFSWPKELDGESYIAVTAAQAPVHKTPDERAPLAGQLSWEIVRLLQPWDGNSAWACVVLPGDGQGFLAKRFCRGAVDWRTGFEKQPDGAWKMKFFLGRD